MTLLRRGRCAKLKYSLRSKKQLSVANIIELRECVVCVKDDLMLIKKRVEHQAGNTR